MHLINWPYYQLWLIVRNLSWDLPIALKMQICKCRFNNISGNIQNKLKVMQSEWHYAYAICMTCHWEKNFKNFCIMEGVHFYCIYSAIFYTKQVKSNQSQAPRTYPNSNDESCLLAINSTINLNMQVTHLRNIWNFAN